ncbi:MAG: DUF309 domain-containing protein [Elusimicrobia bacterium]|nr:DUF309 domain-containing protein [Elusimicrobiota bacterium]
METADLVRVLEDARAQLDKREFFEAHDTIEPAWMKADGELKTALQGLVQICAGLHKHRQGEAAGARYLLGRGLSKIDKGRSSLPPGTAEPFERAGLRAFAQLGEGA